MGYSPWRRRGEPAVRATRRPSSWTYIVFVLAQGVKGVNDNVLRAQHRLAAKGAGCVLLAPRGLHPVEETCVAQEMAAGVDPDALEGAVADFAQLKGGVNIAVEVVLLLCHLGGRKAGGRGGGREKAGNA